MRKIIITLLLPALLLTSCTREERGFSAGDGLKISISCGQLTKADTQAGEDNLNENALKDAWVFLFPSGTLPSDASVAVSPENRASYAEKVVFASGTKNTTSFTLNPTLEQVNEIFPTVNGSAAESCDIFVLVNYRGSETFQTLPTLSTLQNLAIEATFKGNDPGTSISSQNYKVQDDFVMTGSGTVSLNRQTSPYSGSCSINLRRLASKISLSINVKSEIAGQDDDGDSVIWEPVHGSIRMKIVNAKSKGLVGGGEYATSENGLSGDALKSANGFFEYYMRTGTTSSETIDPTANPVVTRERCEIGPFYSYSNSWDASDAFEESGEVGQTGTYAYIEVPFQIKNSTGVNYTYYKYKVRLLSNGLKPNKWYTQKVNIELLGALHQGETIPEILDNSFTVKDWTTISTNVEIQDNRYLDVTYSGNVSVDKTSAYNEIFGVTETETDDNGTEVAKKIPVVMLDNLEDVSVTYASSPSIKLTSVTKYYYDFSGTNAAKVTTAAKGAGTVTSISGAGTSETPWTATFMDGSDSRPVTAYTDKNSLRIHHGLENRDSDTDTKYDVSAFYIKLHIRHEDLTDDTKDGTYSDIYIVQKPAISIVADYTGDTYGTTGACVFVNGYSDGGTHGLATSGTDSANNKNWNQYVISISKLNPESEYIISDSRVDRENASNLNWTSVSAKDMNNVWRNLSYYRESKSEQGYDKFIAPSYRFASSHGAMTGAGLTQRGAIRRCASYQENGYPAGRWRVPTYAEVEFAMSMSLNNMMPALFTSGLSYWTSTGLIRITETGITKVEDFEVTSYHPVRCVYDEWYWTDKLTDTQKSTFTWGDMQ